jgi:phosphoribosylglycinamide formyltransferase-1
MRLKSVGLITYDYPHLKSEQVIHNLMRRKDYIYKIYALPFKPRPKREVLFNHRPDQTNAIATEVIARKHNIPYIKVNSDREIDNSCEIYLILGGGILSAECVKGKKIINCHPGIIPIARGLDAFKWSIYELAPLGVTLHFINSEVDSGEVISVIPTEVYFTDTLDTLARRHYENEIDVLSNFEYYLDAPINNFRHIQEKEPHRRMPVNIEKEMIQMFDKYVNKYGN